MMKVSTIGLAALFVLAAGNPFSPPVAGDGASPWGITPEEYLDSPGVSVPAADRLLGGENH